MDVRIIDIDVRTLIASELEEAARILRRHTDGKFDASAAWRIADAGLDLRDLIESGGAHSALRVTGKGAVLPFRTAPFAESVAAIVISTSTDPAAGATAFPRLLTGASPAAFKHVIALMRRWEEGLTKARTPSSN